MKHIMLANDIILGDFHRLPYSAQSLYLFLMCHADQYGFVTDTLNKICKASYTADILENLQKKGFVIIIDENTVLISDYFTHSARNIDVDPARENVYENIKLEGGRLVWRKNGPTAKREKVFVPPTREEVRAYAKERNSNVDPDFFYDYFSAPNERNEIWINSNGKPVVAWKQTFCTWERSGYGRPRRNSDRNPQQSAKGDSGSVSKWGVRYDVDGRSEG